VLQAFKEAFKSMNSKLCGKENVELVIVSNALLLFKILLISIFGITLYFIFPTVLLYLDHIKGADAYY
jgi:hypothetical protein